MSATVGAWTLAVPPRGSSWACSRRSPSLRQTFVASVKGRASIAPRRLVYIKAASGASMPRPRVLCGRRVLVEARSPSSSGSVGQACIAHSVRKHAPRVRTSIVSGSPREKTLALTREEPVSRSACTAAIHLRSIWLNLVVCLLKKKVRWRESPTPARPVFGGFLPFFEAGEKITVVDSFNQAERPVGSGTQAPSSSFMPAVMMLISLRATR